ncbi:MULTISPECIES: ABC transporter ATP-binding protein [unclassified Methanoculleus]|jgi:iron complex transport system ATP-binding protein|uniref:ABC transporter ATP-binding protein n=1 Tax=unclassified Methanoculleus TaxID=2619537 RepID=UPI0025EF115C|nr:ABC transporter ATP-binding protein [Methanoculleus sp. UBA377]MDD2473864.1 ABC transporter ATP-binding protein [Methanoculleus sp.]
MSLEISHLSFAYSRRTRLVLDDVSFSVKKGDLLAVLGPNGVGKSTMFRCILGFLRNYKGSIRLNGKDIRTLDHKEIAKHIAYIPQSTYPVFNYTVLDVILMGTTNQLNLLSVPGQKQIDEAYAAMDNLGITHLRNAGYGEISGGERQLALIARALVQKARILIMDEPTANLDYGNQFRVMCRISGLAQEGYIIILSTHNPDHAFLYANRTLMIYGGKVIADGTPEDVLDAKLIRDVYGMDVHIEECQCGSRHHRLCIPIIGATEKYG